MGGAGIMGVGQPSMNQDIAMEFLSNYMPEGFLDSFAGSGFGFGGGNGMMGPQSSMNAQADMIRTAENFVEYILSQEKEEMAEDVNEELFVYRESLMMLAGEVEECDWECVKNCSDMQFDVKSKASCLDLCGCYKEKAKIPKVPKLSFDYKQVVKNGFAYVPTLSLQ